MATPYNLNMNLTLYNNDVKNNVATFVFFLL